MKKAVSPVEYACRSGRVSPGSAVMNTLDPTSFYPLALGILSWGSVYWDSVLTNNENTDKYSAQNGVNQE